MQKRRLFMPTANVKKLVSHTPSEPTYRITCGLEILRDKVPQSIVRHVFFNQELKLGSGSVLRLVRESDSREYIFDDHGELEKTASFRPLFK